MTIDDRVLLERERDLARKVLELEDAPKRERQRSSAFERQTAVAVEALKRSYRFGVTPPRPRESDT